MARIRSIKPEFWSSAQVMECAPITRLFFIGLWNFCDDKGRCPASAKQLKAQVFPGDDISSENILGMIQELSKIGLIQVYRVGGKEFLVVTGWSHQRIDKPQKHKFPGPDEADEDDILDQSKNDRRTLATDLIGSEGIGSDIEANQQAKSTSSARVPASSLADFKIQITQAFQRVGSQAMPDTGRLDVWIAQGFDPAICVAVVADGIVRNPTVRGLKYFDGAIADAHENRRGVNGNHIDPSLDPRKIKGHPQEVIFDLGCGFTLPLRNLESTLKLLREKDFWAPGTSSPRPAQKGCKIPDEYLPDDLKQGTRPPVSVAQKTAGAPKVVVSGLAEFDDDTERI